MEDAILLELFARQVPKPSRAEGNRLAWDHHENSQKRDYYKPMQAFCRRDAGTRDVIGGQGHGRGKGFCLSVSPLARSMNTMS